MGDRTLAQNSTLDHKVQEVMGTTRNLHVCWLSNQHIRTSSVPITLNLLNKSLYLTWAQEFYNSNQIVYIVRACKLSHFSRVRLFATLWTTALQASLSVGFSRQESWSRLLCPPPGALTNSGICLFCLLHWQAGSVPLAAPTKPLHR